MTLAILVPSRGRPHNLTRLIGAVGATAETDWRMWVRIDDDDPTVDEYESVVLDTGEVILVRGHRTRFAASVNELAQYALEDGAEYLAILGDDVVPETQGWDRMLIDSLGGKLGVAYGSDGLEHMHAPDLPTHVAVPTELFRRLGWIGLPTATHLFLDNAWRVLGQKLGNFQYVPGAKLSHYHPWRFPNEVPRDQTYAEANSSATNTHDRKAFEKWEREQSDKDVARVLAGWIHQ